MHRVHYAWFVCIGGFLAMCVAVGLSVNIFPYYLPGLLEEEGFTNTQGSLLGTVRTVTTILSLLAVNRLCLRLGPRTLTGLGCLLVSASYLGCRLSGSFPLYCVSFALMGAGYCFCGAVPVSLILSRWFERRRALAMSITMASSGVPPLLLPAALMRLRAWGGLDAEFTFLAILCLAMGIPAWLLLRNAPEEMGMEPYRGGAAEEAPAARPEAPALSRGQRLTILLVALLAGGPGGAAFSFLAVYLRGSGYSEAAVTALVSYLGLIIVLGKLPCGQIYDKLGSRRGHAYIMGTLAVSMCLFLLFPLGSVPLAFLCLTFFGLGLPIGSVTTYQWSGDLYPAEEYASAVRSASLSLTLGIALFSPLSGILADRYGSYQPAYLLYLLALLLSAVLLAAVYLRTGAGRRAR